VKAGGAIEPGVQPRVGIATLDDFCRAALAACGANDATVDAATRAMMHGSRLGVDSHGVRLLGHYVKALRGGRVKTHPSPAIVRGTGAVALLDADHGHGALGAYVAVRHAVRLARSHGIGAVSVTNSSHFGPAGAFAIEAAHAGLVGLAFCNSDSFVRLHGGAARFHGTNPIACAVPVAGARPWLLDMATSAIPYNRVQLYRSTGARLPDGVASADDGVDTADPHSVEMLAPLGDAFGFKGAGLAGMVEIFSAVLSGALLSSEILPMAGPDMKTPRRVGAFVMAIDPEAFVPRAVFDDGMRRYLEALRGSPSRRDAQVLAPGDREWAEVDLRDKEGVPIDPDTQAAFSKLAEEFGLASPFDGEARPSA
jgi:LDH2 family malate/lactate/ureidoglycolate dehydrogenase